VNMLDVELQAAARERLRELAATFANGGTGKLRGELLADAVRAELDEVWLSVHGWRLRMACRNPKRGWMSSWLPRPAKQ
jgi:hypothetical protein